LYSRFLSGGRNFPDRYMSMLAAGGSDWPAAIVGTLGVDLADPGFWAQGLALLEEMTGQAETLADRLTE
jgi:oligoendopeptidase F